MSTADRVKADYSCNVTVGHDVGAPTIRMRQMSAMFDAPIEGKLGRSWQARLPLSERDWQIGAVIGPSGSGKSTCARNMFGEPTMPTWPDDASVVDAFDASLSIEEISNALGSVGFNTIPSWMRPYRTLSNGERFRCDLARVLLDPHPLVWVDEFTSVVDRQTACVGSHAVARFVRKQPTRQLVVASCHYDIVDWLQPDWVFEPATCFFAWRSVQLRPRIEGVIKRCERDLWRLFAPYHYLTAHLHKAARCFALYVGDRPVAFVALLPVPVSRGADAGTAIVRVSRVVVLPDWQGVGVAFKLCDSLAAAYKTIGSRFRNYPAHPPYVTAHRRRPEIWEEIMSPEETMRRPRDNKGSSARPCAVFEYVGPALSSERAARYLLAH